MPETDPGTPGLTDRRRDILAIVAEQGFATIEALARRFDVSAQTVRRDIIHLQREGLVRRFHGGAGPPDAPVRLTYDTKKTVSRPGKDAIGAAVAALVPDGSSLFLDVGTTVEAAARALLARRSLRIFTPSLPAALIFADHGSAEVFVTGGLLGGLDGSLVGPAAVEAIGRFRVDFALVGCSGVDADGSVMDFDTQKVAAKRAMMAGARRRLLLADASKFGRPALMRLGAASEFHVLVTDAEPPAQLRKAFASGGPEILVAAPA
jgi:DeoR family glycerol-3-phosphate regulon repressor